MKLLEGWNFVKRAAGLTRTRLLPPVGDDETEERRQEALSTMKKRVAEFNVGLNARIYRLEAIAGVVIRVASPRDTTGGRG